MFAGAFGAALQGEGHTEGFLLGGLFGLTDPQAYDYSLNRDSPAIDAGIAIPVLENIDLIPSAEYVHRTNARKRQVVWTLDICAHEFCGL